MSRIAQMTLIEVKEEIALCLNNSGNIWSETDRRQHQQHLAMLLNRKWELEGVRGRMLLLVG